MAMSKFPSKIGVFSSHRTSMRPATRDGGAIQRPGFSYQTVNQPMTRMNGEGASKREKPIVEMQKLRLSYDHSDHPQNRLNTES